MVKIISGKAHGADELGERLAKEYGLEIKSFPAEWDRLGKSAGYVRNIKMAQYAAENGSDGILIAFWDGKSRGTKHMIEYAEKYGLKVYIIKF